MNQEGTGCITGSEGRALVMQMYFRYFWLN